MQDLVTSSDQTIDSTALNDCWNQIGVMGDRSCDRLSTVMHCYDCPVYAAAGDSLLQREPQQNYLDEWIRILSEAPSDPEDTESEGALVGTTDAISVMIFRLGKEWLSLPVRILQEVTAPCVIQPVPHRSNELFLGLVNIRGETLLCASLSYLLNLNADEDTATSSSKRMILAGQGDEKWVFPVDEVHGVFRFHSSELQDAPIVVAKAAEAYTQGIVHWQNQKVGYLDSELLFYTLNHKIF
ncbi:purine-binding chemotaxis protein CheW [Cyanobacteria bacterium FACHB-63]|nr:purine-binding chemotaxis protein CheW [Cyanobacteria bacterium FACHB-63]